MDNFYSSVFTHMRAQTGITNDAHDYGQQPPTYVSICDIGLFL